MSRDFNVPPVIFPSSSGNSGIQNQRRNPNMAPSFQPPNSATSGGGIDIPFMSFDIGSASASSSSPAFAGNIYDRGGVSFFGEEPPLLEELGINTRQIWRKTKAILNPFRVNASLHEDADLSGPFLFLTAFGLFQLLGGKLHFGILLGWITVVAFFLYIVFNMLEGRNGNLDLYRCVSIIGYCMLPIVIFSGVSLLLPHRGPAIFLMEAAFVLWSTRTCTKLLVDLASCGDGHRWLLAYACFLIYALFSLLVIF